MLRYSAARGALRPSPTGKKSAGVAEPKRQAIAVFEYFSIPNKHEERVVMKVVTLNDIPNVPVGSQRTICPKSYANGRRTKPVSTIKRRGARSAGPAHR